MKEEGLILRGPVQIIGCTMHKSCKHRGDVGEFGGYTCMHPEVQKQMWIQKGYGYTVCLNPDKCKLREE